MVISKSNIFTEKKRPPTWKLECVVDEDPEKLLTMLKGNYSKLISHTTNQLIA